MKNSGIYSLLFITAFALPTFAQTYNSNTGGYNTGYGHMYGSFGMAMATQNMYNLAQMQMQKSMMRSAMIKKFGLAAVEKAEREAGSRSTSGSAKAAPSNPEIVVAPPRVVRNYGKFRPDATVDTGKILADAIGETPEEKALLKQVYTAVKAGYDKQAAAKGWQNNISGALTFFIVSNATIYHDSAEPSDETVAALYDAMNQTIDEIPEFGRMANKDKQAFSNMLIGFAAIPLATYTEGKQNGDAATVSVARQLAGELIELVLKSKPENVKFEDGRVVIN